MISSSGVCGGSSSCWCGAASAGTAHRRGHDRQGAISGLPAHRSAVPKASEPLADGFFTRGRVIVHVPVAARRRQGRLAIATCVEVIGKASLETGRVIRGVNGAGTGGHQFVPGLPSQPAIAPAGEAVVLVQVKQPRLAQRGPHDVGHHRAALVRGRMAAGHERHQGHQAYQGDQRRKGHRGREGTRDGAAPLERGKGCGAGPSVAKCLLASHAQKWMLSMVTTRESTKTFPVRRDNRPVARGIHSVFGNFVKFEDAGAEWRRIVSGGGSERGGTLRRRITGGVGKGLQICVVNNHSACQVDCRRDPACTDCGSARRTQRVRNRDGASLNLRSPTTSATN